MAAESVAPLREPAPLDPDAEEKEAARLAEELGTEHELDPLPEADAQLTDAQLGMDAAADFAVDAAREDRVFGR
jgi:hypothetical protein